MTLSRFVQLQEQTLADAVAWHEANGHFKSDEQREAFRAAWAQAWRECRACLSLNGDLSLTVM